MNSYLVMLIGFVVVIALLLWHLRRQRRVEQKVMNGYFLLGLSGLMAKIALADGTVSDSETHLALRFFKNMKLTDSERATCIGNFVFASREQMTVRDLANRFIAFATPAACEYLFVLLWRISKADGVLDPAEEAMLAQIASCLGVSSVLLEKLKAGATPSFSASVLRGAGVPESLVALEM